MTKISKKLFKESFAYKLFAVVVAIALWFYVVQIQNPVEERLFEVPLDFKNLPADMAVSEKVDFVKVRIQGNKNIIEDVLSKDIDAYLDLKNANIGQNVGKINIVLPEKVQLVSVNPIDIAVEVQELIEVQLPVDIEYVGTKVAEGYSALSPIIFPNQVIISGPKGKIEEIDKVYLTVNLTEANKNFEASVPINIKDKSGNSLNSWVTIRPVNADVFIPIISAVPEKVAPISAGIVGEPANGYMITRIIIEPTVVTAYGVQAELDKISYIYTNSIDIENAKNDVSVKTPLLTPEGIRLDVSKEITVAIKIEEIQTKTLENVLISMSGSDSNYNYSLSQNSIRVKVSGPKSLVSTLTAGGISAELNLGGIEIGRHSFSPVIKTVPGVTIQSIEPQTIAVDITNK